MNRINCKVTEIEASMDGGKFKGRVVVLTGTGTSAAMNAVLAEALRAMTPATIAVADEEPAPRGAQWKSETRGKPRR